jgi:hypothetical protein
MSLVAATGWTFLKINCGSEGATARMTEVELAILFESKVIRWVTVAQMGFLGKAGEIFCKCAWMSSECRKCDGFIVIWGGGIIQYSNF